MGRRTVPVTIQGHEYRIRSDAEAAQVRRAAALVDETMARVRDRTGTVDSLDVAVLAALNIAHRLVSEREGNAGAWVAPEAMAALLERVETLLETEDARAL
jgi:cell division protein ZapA